MLKEIQCLNAIAITAMETQDYREAAEALKHALSELSSCVLEPSPLETEGVISDLGDDCIELEAVLTPCLRSPSAANGDFYHYPFSIESERVFKDEGRASHLSREEHARCTIACFYNLALCHQLQWLKTKSSSRLLQGAIKYYQDAYAFAHTFYQNNLTPRDSLLCVIMATCTNVASSLVEMGQVPQISFWSGQLSRLVLFAHEGQERSNFFALTAFHNNFGYHTAQAA